MDSGRTRRIYFCGCNRRSGLIGMANGVALTAPICELAARRWIRNVQIPCRTPSIME